MNTVNKEKVMLFWSGGKDCALALYYLLQDANIEVVGLITKINKESNTVPFHGIPDTLLIQQARMLNLPLQRIFLSENCSNSEYTSRISEILSMFGKRGIKKIAFGDTTVSELSEFHENILRTLNITPIFPILNKSSEAVARELFSLGYKALITSIDQTQLDKSFLNCEYNQEFLSRLPRNATNLSFHTFVIFGPGFKSRVAFSKSIAIIEEPYLVSLLKEP